MAREQAPGWAVHLDPGRPGPLDLTAAGTLLGRLAQVVSAEGSRPLVFDEESGWTTRAAFLDRTTALAGRLAAAGLEPGDHIVMSAGPSTALAVAHVAALRLGLVVVPMNTAYTPREIRHVVSDAGARGAVVDDGARAAALAEAAAPEGRFVVGRLEGTEVTGLPASPVACALDAAKGEDPALLVYTSGTTGSPKGAALSHANLLSSAEAVRLAWRWREDDRLVLSLPLFHVHGLGVGLHGTLAAGGSVVLRRRFDPSDLSEAVARHKATMFFGVPTIYARLAASSVLTDALAPLRLCVSGSAPLPAELHRQVAEAAGQAILERYGMSETLMIASNPYDGERRPGTVGLPLPGVELVIDPGGTRAAAGGAAGEAARKGGGAAGEILVRGPNVFSSYWRRPEATAAAFEGGWFRTGDLGRLEPDGYLRIAGRKAELVISGGYNVYPREVEDVLRMHPAVSDAAVVGRPHPEWGEEVVAFVEPVPGDEHCLGDLADFAADRLAPYKRPKRLVMVESLPRNALGKVVKGELA